MKNSNFKKRILVLGGTGFIGARLVKRLQDNKEIVNLLVYDKIPGFFSKENLVIFKGDITDKKTLIEAVKNSDIIVNLVGTFNEKMYYPLNVASSVNLLDVCKKFGHIKKIIFISSEAVYGDYSGRPYSEKDIPKPTTEYGFSKFLAEEIYRFYSEKYKIPVIILRLANTYGPGHRVGVISECISSAFKNQPVKIHRTGEQRRDFLYVDDAVNGIIKSIAHKAKEFEIFNISGEKTYSLLEMVSLTEKIICTKIKIKFMAPKKQDVLHMEESHEKAVNVLGYNPKTNLQEGITMTVDYLKNN
jgi:UDP-glucose 4-epimerase